MLGIQYRNPNDFFRLFPKYLKVEAPYVMLQRTVTQADGFRDGATLLS
jgi:hypothetical protein